MVFYISSSIEDYVRAIYLLETRYGEARSKKLSEYLSVQKSSVSEMVLKLRKTGFVNYARYSTVSLTKKGRELAEKLTFKHRVIEAFLTKMLNRDKREVHNEAPMLEHAFSDESVGAIYRLLGKPKVGVHGETIPKL